MKLTNLSFIVLIGAVACSKNDSPPALENAKVATTTIQPPAGLTTAATTGGNTYAAEAYSYIQSANAISGYSALFAVAPSGATKSSTAITASNGRVSGTAASTVTYTWSDPQYGSVAYQITDDGTNYKWEYFYKAVGADWLKYLDATEKKDGSSGNLRVFDIYGSDASVVALKYEWTKNLDVYTFKMTADGYYFNLTMSISTKAGSIDVYESNVLSAKYTWTATGSGTWQTFDSQGSVSGSGTW